MSSEIFNINYEPLFSSRSPICTEKVDKQSQSSSDDSFPTTEIYSANSTTSTAREINSTTYNFKINRMPDGFREEMVTLCFASEVLKKIRDLKFGDCEGCYYSALSQKHHTCLVTDYKETIKAHFQKAIENIDLQQVRRRVRCFEYHPKYSLCQISPSRKEFDYWIDNCMTIWCEFIYDLVISEFSFVKLFPFLVAREIDVI